ncbi:Tetratricopeptide repeat-containing protein [Pelagirhabdus alkalitolerans]|uniref:Tetratricopeptide repeat-containing protein n=1 Tax=Pelagirhabdus alkalitolerans TaxID=1612202 RepID=A0A1G6MUZ7_9BACI|nr:tetratricopeptide repeat protein [Pelagirhabdus alkalitolerans]SDC59261.1 Tetratricopeptide repeat-containing protein [Pelagirhabdus alkalitolerans]
MVLTTDLNIQNKQKIIPLTLNSEFYFQKGIDAFYKHKFERAEKWILKAMELNPNEAVYPSQLSVLYTETGAYHKANQVLLDVLDQHGDTYFDCYYLLANNFAHLGLLKEAERYAEAYLEKDPTGEFASETEQLLTLLDMSLEEETDDWVLEREDELLKLQETAFYYMQRQHYKEALAVLNELLEHFPEHIVAKYDYQFALFFSGEKEKALEYALKERTDTVYSLFNLITFYYHLGQKEKAYLLSNQLMNLMPIQVEKRLRIALVFSEIVYLEKAYERFDALPSQKVQHFLTYYREFARTSYDMGYTEKAQKIWEKACLKHPDLKEERPPWQSF